MNTIIDFLFIIQLSVSRVTFREFKPTELGGSKEIIIASNLDFTGKLHFWYFGNM
jgi:hypothetical protein